MNMRIVKVLGLILLMCYCALTYATTNVDPNLPPDIAAIKARGILRVGIFKADAPPLAMHDSNGKWIGIEIDLATMIAQQLGVKLEIIPAPTYDSMVDMVASGQLDLATELAFLPQRGLRVAFTHPYYSFNPHLLVNRLQAAKNGWSKPDDIIQALTTNPQPMSIGVLEGTAGVQLIENTFPNAKIVLYPTVPAALQDVTTGKIFAALGTSPAEVQDYLQNNPRASLLSADIQIPNASFLIGMALPWQYYHFRELLNSYFSYLNQNGVLEEIFQKYGESLS